MIKDAERNQTVTVGEENESRLFRSLQIYDDYIFETEEAAAALDTQKAMERHRDEFRKSVFEVTKSV